MTLVTGVPGNAPDPALKVIVAPAALMVLILAPDAVVRPLEAQNFKSGVVLSEILLTPAEENESLEVGFGSVYQGSPFAKVLGVASTTMSSYGVV